MSLSEIDSSLQWIATIAKFAALIPPLTPIAAPVATAATIADEGVKILEATDSHVMEIAGRVEAALRTGNLQQGHIDEMQGIIDELADHSPQ